MATSKVQQKSSLYKKRKKAGLEGSASSTNADKTKKQISNYKTRMEAMGVDTDTRNPVEKLFNLPENQNVFFDIMEILNRPQQALLGSIDSMQKGEDAWKGFMDGLSGNKEASGGQILRNAGMSGNGEFNLLNPSSYKNASLSDFLGFGIDLITDPMDWALFAASGGTSALAKQAAKSAAKTGAKGTIQIADDVLDTLKNTSKLAKGAGIASDTTKAVSNLNDLLDTMQKSTGFVKTIKKSAGGLLTDKAGDAIKGSFRLADKGVEKGLGALDNAKNARANKVLEGVVKDIPQSNMLDSYKAIKKQVKDTFDYAKSLPGNLVKKVQEASGKADFVVRQSEPSFKEYQEFILDYVKKANPNVTSKEEMEALLDTANKTATLLYENKMPLEINGKRWLSTIASKDNELIASKESIDSISDILNKHGIKFKVEDIPRMGQRLVVDTSQKKALINAFKDNDEIKEQIGNTILKRTREYSPEQLALLEKYGKDKEFTQVVDKIGNYYKNLTKYSKEAGVDLAPIFEREGYMRLVPNFKLDDDYNILEASRLSGGKALFDKNTIARRKYKGERSIVNEVLAKENTQNIEKIDKHIENLNDNFSEQVIEKQRIKVDELRNKSINASKKQAEIANNLSKVDNDIATQTKKSIASKTASKELDDALSREVTKKVKSMDNLTLSKRYVDSTNKLTNLLTDKSKLVEQLGTDLDDKTVKQITKKIASLDKKIGKAEASVAFTTSCVKGQIDKATQQIIDNAESYATKKAEEELTQQAISNNIKELREKKNLLNQSYADTVDSVNQQLREAEMILGDMLKPEKRVIHDAKIKKQIEYLQQARSTLENRPELFNLNASLGMADAAQATHDLVKGAILYNDTLGLGLFSNKNYVKLGSDLVDGKVPMGFVPVNLSKTRGALNSVKDFIPNDAQSVLDLFDSWGSQQVYMDKNLARILNVVSKPKQEVNAFLNMLDGYTRTFKKFSTFTLGNQFKNLVGNFTNMWLSGVPLTDMPKLYKEAISTSNNMNNIFKKISEQGVDALSDIERKQYRVIKKMYEGGFIDAFTKIRDIEDIAGGNASLLQQNTKNKSILKAWSDMNTRVDLINRMALFDYAEKNPKYLSNLGLSSPMEAIGLALGDPGNMSEAERKVIKRLIPFYTFSKQNMIYQATNILKNTPKYTKLAKVFNKMYDGLDEDQYYEYQKSGFQIPMPIVDDDGNQMFLKTSIPVSDLGELLGNPVNKVVNMTTPLIKTPFEQATGVSTFTGKELNRSTFETIAQSLGVQNITTNMWNRAKSIYDRLNGKVSDIEMWSEIFKSMVQDTNREKVAKSKAYEELEYYQKMVSNLKKQGIDVPTIRELQAASNVNLINLKNKRKRTRNLN